MHPLILTLLDTASPFRYVPTLILPVVIAVALIAVIVYLLRRTNKRRAG